MKNTPLSLIYQWFQTGSRPTQQHFHQTFAAFWHKDDSIPLSSISGIDRMFQGFASKEGLNGHTESATAHVGHLLRLDGTNVTPSNRKALRTILGIGELPAHSATVDGEGHIGNVLTKSQSEYLNTLLTRRIAALEGLNTNDYSHLSELRILSVTDVGDSLALKGEVTVCMLGGVPRANIPADAVRLFIDGVEEVPSRREWLTGGGARSSFFVPGDSGNTIRVSGVVHAFNFTFAKTKSLSAKLAERNNYAAVVFAASCFEGSGDTILQQHLRLTNK